MMMPANFSAVSENEMTYVVGGGLVDTLATAMGDAEWKKFNTNMITIIGNAYLDSFVKGTVGRVFSGSWMPGTGVQAAQTKFTGLFDKNWVAAAGEGEKNGFWGNVVGSLNAGLWVVGNLAAIYNLGFGTVDNAAKSASITKQ